MIAAVQPASAFGLERGISAPSTTVTVQEGRCFRWRRICANRHPEGDWRFRRCLAGHACL
jgi:hypothetical protein